MSFYSFMWLVPLLPFAGFFLLVFLGRGMGRRAAGLIGVGSVGLSAAVTLILAVSFFTAPPAGGAIVEKLWSWVALAGLQIDFSFHFDALTLTMMGVITGVGFLIHLYSSEFMADDGELALFFAYMNLFIASMLILVMADNLLLLYLGWEGVGLCSYLLIGFWHRDPANGRAARKAFIVTRVGDAAMLVGFGLIALSLGTLNIQELMQRAQGQWAAGSTLPVVAAALLLAGAIGKSAQVPLHVWLPDAMAGPTPVSALIHAATMVTAGVYLIARTHLLFALAPVVQLVVAVIGLATLLVAGLSAIAQVDIKRVLAYSTISQIGYMFLGLGVGFYSAAVFHFMVHAFFKALLFLAAGAVIMAQDHEHNMFRMGGLARVLPVTFWCFLIGAASLSALPLVTAGFYSKEWILGGVWDWQPAGKWLWLGAGGIGVLLTSIYSFRAVFITFAGEQKIRETHRPGARIHVPLVILAVLSIGAGLLQIPPTIAKVDLFQSYIGPVFAASGAAGAAAGGGGAVQAAGGASAGTQAVLQITASLLSLLGVLIAWIVYRRGLSVRDRLADPAEFRGIRRFLFVGLAFDWAYGRLFVKPFTCAAALLRRDFVEYFYLAIGAVNKGFNRFASSLQGGKVRWYLAGIALGAVIALGVVVWL